MQHERKLRLSTIINCHTSFNFWDNYVILPAMGRRSKDKITALRAKTSNFLMINLDNFLKIPWIPSNKNTFFVPSATRLKMCRPCDQKKTENSTRLNIQCQACSFNGAHYRQVIGVAMGSVNGPKLSLFVCWLVGFVEDQILNQYNGFISQLYRRYVDDVVGAS